MVKTILSNYPFVEAHHKGGRQKPTAIFIRLSYTISKKDAALAIANRWHKANSPVESCHYVVDEQSVYQCVPDNVVAFHKKHVNKGSISINVCSYPIEFALLWDELDRMNVIDKTAELVAELSIIHKIPIKYLNDAEIMRWNKRKWRLRGGIILGVEGTWPRLEFREKVYAFRDEFNRAKK